MECSDCLGTGKLEVNKVVEAFDSLHKKEKELERIRKLIVALEDM